MFSLRFTIKLFFILIIHLFLRFYGVEPYPAVLLPAGGGSIKKVNNQIDLKSKNLYALDNMGNWKKINITRFLYPIPISYIPNVISNNFGFDVDSSSMKSKGFKILRKLHIVNVSIKSKEEIEEVKNWLKRKLIQQGFSPFKIKITSYIQTISTDTGTVLENKVKYERIISLD